MAKKRSTGAGRASSPPSTAPPTARPSAARPAIEAPRERSWVRAGSPARYAAGFAALLGLTLIGFGFYLCTVAEPPIMPLRVALILIGVIEIATAWYALHKVRSAWAFALSLNGTGFVALLFGAPKVRDAGEVAGGVALLPALGFLALTVLFALARDEY